MDDAPLFTGPADPKAPPRDPLKDPPKALHARLATLPRRSPPVPARLALPPVTPLMRWSAVDPETEEFRAEEEPPPPPVGCAPGRAKFQRGLILRGTTKRKVLPAPERGERAGGRGSDTEGEAV